MLAFLMVIESVEARNKLEALYLKYHKYIFYIANDILKNSHEAQDVVQTVVLKLVNYLDRIEDITCNKTKHLIVTITKSTSIDLLRKRDKLTFLCPEAFEEMDDLRVPASEEIVIKLSEAKELLEKLTAIREEYADILTLKYYQELSDQEIADILCISHDNVRTRLSRAKKALKRLMIGDSEHSFYVRGMCENERSIR